MFCCVTLSLSFSLVAFLIGDKRILNEIWNVYDCDVCSVSNACKLNDNRPSMIPTYLICFVLFWFFFVCVNKCILSMVHCTTQFAYLLRSAHTENQIRYQLCWSFHSSFIRFFISSCLSFKNVAVCWHFLMVTQNRCVCSLPAKSLEGRPYQPLCCHFKTNWKRVL